MGETWQEERARLFIRTAELKARSREMATPFRLFSQTEHDLLREQLHRHFLALAEFRERCVAHGRWQPRLPLGSLRVAPSEPQRPLPHAS